MERFGQIVEQHQPWMLISYVILVFVLAHLLQQRRKRHLLGLLNALPDHSRRLMQNEPWLRVPPFADFDSPADHAYRRTFRITKWPERLLWLGFFASFPLYQWHTQGTAQ